MNYEYIKEVENVFLLKAYNLTKKYNKSHIFEARIELVKNHTKNLYESCIEIKVFDKDSIIDIYCLDIVLIQNDKVIWFVEEGEDITFEIKKFLEKWLSD